MEVDNGKAVTQSGSEVGVGIWGSRGWKSHSGV